MLGTGGMASVWLARDQRLDRPVAIKVIADRLGADPQWRQRFEREARAAASVSHPHIVQVFDYGVDGDQPYLVMEYISGGSLADRLALGETDTPALDVSGLAQALLDALAHIHDVGIIHRDVKPGNILLGRDGRARLTDFGIAQPQDATQLTQTGLVLGTLMYLAPEVLRGNPATVASDLYAAGVVLREASGADPSPALANLITRLTAAAPEQRPTAASTALALLGAPPVAGDSEPTAATRALGSTAATRVVQPRMLQAAQPPARKAPISTRPQAPMAGSKHRNRGISKRRWLAGLVTAFALIIIVIAASSGGGTPSTPTSKNIATPALPRPGAPLQQQLNALDQIVNHAAGQSGS
jgi:eukaryotic-like serine/threonine-protein kinase